MSDRIMYPSWVLTFLAGSLAGAAAALLMAPQSGRATRDAMRRRLREADESARGIKDRALRRGEEIRDEAKHRVGAAASALAGKNADGSASV